MYGDAKQRKGRGEGLGREPDLGELREALRSTIELSNRPSKCLAYRGRQRLQLRTRVSKKNDRHDLPCPVNETSDGGSPPRLLPRLRATVGLEESVRVLHIFSVHLAFDELNQESVPVLSSGLELLKQSERRSMYRHAGHRVRGGGHSRVRAV